MSQKDSNNEEFLPDTDFDSDDSRRGEEYVNTVTNRPRTRAYVSNNPDPLANLVGLVDEIKKITDPTHTDNTRVGPAVAPRTKRKGGVLIEYARNASDNRLGNSAEHCPAATADDANGDAAATNVSVDSDATVETTNIIYHTHTDQGHAKNNNTCNNIQHTPTDPETDEKAHTHTATQHDGTVHISSPVNNTNNTINPNKIKMTLKLGEALGLIPCFDGTIPSDIFPFINACDIALKSVATDDQPVLLQVIRTKLRGEAFACTQYRDVEAWESLKALLQEEYCAQRTPAHLQLELNSTRQREGETVSTYSSRIQTLFHQLCNASVLDKPTNEAKIIREHIKGQTLAIFIEGLRQPIKTIIKAGKPASLEVAIKDSLEEERTYMSDKESQRFFSNPKPTGKTKYCSRCKTNTHNTENCRFIRSVPMSRANTNYAQQTHVKHETPST